MKNFVAIDFETANNHRQRVCSVGIVVVRDGAIVERFEELIRPAHEYYCGWATEIHGIGPDDTTTARLFPEVWRDVAVRIGDLPTVAAHIGFDFTNHHNALADAEACVAIAMRILS